MYKIKIYTILLGFVLLVSVGCVGNEQTYLDNHDSFIEKMNSESYDLLIESIDIEIEAYDAYYLGDHKTAKSKYILYQSRINYLEKIAEKQQVEIETLYEADKINSASYNYLILYNTYELSDYKYSLLYAENMLKSVDASVLDEQLYYELALMHYENSVLNRNACYELEPPLFYI